MGWEGGLLGITTQDRKIDKLRHGGSLQSCVHICCYGRWRITLKLFKSIASEGKEKGSTHPLVNGKLKWWQGKSRKTAALKREREDRTIQMLCPFSPREKKNKLPRTANRKKQEGEKQANSGCWSLRCQTLDSNIHINDRPLFLF